MKRLVIASIVVALSVAAAIAEDQPRTRKLTGEQRRAKRAAKIKAEGGLVTKPYDGRYVVIENAQTIVAQEDLMPKGSGIDDLFGFPIKYVAKGGKAEKTALHITVSQDPGAPTLLVAPEIPWAQVNVKALGADGAKHDVVVARTQKEIWRAFMMCCGAANSNMSPCVMRTICSLGALDSQPVRVPCPEPMMKVLNAGQELGLKRPEQKTYKLACEEGWAPDPTNDVQKAIWESVGKK